MIIKKLTFALIFFTFTNVAFGNSNLLMEQDGSELDFSKSLKTQKTLQLDDAFLIQLYSRWKALGAVTPQTNELVGKVLNKEYISALKDLDVVTDTKALALKRPIELYLLFKAGYFQTFLSEWIDASTNAQWLGSELSLALDHVVGNQSSKLLVNSGFFLTSKQSELLSQIEEVNLQINYSLQGFKALRTGKKATRWIGKLKEDDILRLYLSYSSVLSYARNGKLGASGKLIKKVVEPWMEETEVTEQVSLYYLTLGRLLYQAKAFEQAAVYYKLVPQTSQYFLQARTEHLWVSLQTRDFSSAMGELATLKLPIFEDRFYPEVFVVSAIGHTMLCEFTDARESINRFISTNKVWAKKIEENKKAETPAMINENFYITRARKSSKNILRELESLNSKEISRYNVSLTKKNDLIKMALVSESRRQWVNKEKILEGALYKMKFVRIEMLSRMRALAEGLKDQIPNQDTISRYEAAPAKANQIIFPNDGMLWGDELFNMSAEVKNQCIQGKFYEK